MKNYKIFAIAIACAAGLAVSAGPARAQDPATTAAVITAPIVINAVTPKPRPQGTVWLKGEVVHADGYTIVVRERANEMAVHTFTFAPAIQTKMQAVLDKGGYQYGDKVSILYTTGQTVALRVHGKPSKPL